MQMISRYRLYFMLLIGLTVAIVGHNGIAKNRDNVLTNNTDTHNIKIINNKEININKNSTPHSDTGWLSDDSNPHAKVRLRARQDDAQQIRLLLDIQLAKGWKTYWRSPGQAGVAPAIRWQGAPDVYWYWPTPQRFTIMGISNQGYSGQVTLPLLINQTSAHLKGVLILSTCQDVCLLTDYPFSLIASNPSVNDQSGSNFNYDFNRAMGQVPPDNGLTDQIQAAVTPHHELHISAWRAAGWHNPALFLDDITGIDFARPHIVTDGGQLQATVTMKPTGVRPVPDLRGASLSLVLADQGLAQQIMTTIAYQPVGEASLPLWRLLLLALAGGLILNIMPCVLPVLGMKLATVLTVQGRHRAQVRRQFIAVSVGIIVSFLLLALFMTTLRLAGSVPGWGVQFQSPWFIAFMALVMLLFSANLFGLFILRLPLALHNKLAIQGGDGMMGHFCQGIFATLLATPCSAPFLGTALTVALVAPYPLLWSTFLALGVGMSLPWLVVAVWPALVLYLPRPGRWMLWLRAVLALLMLISGLWLISLLASHIGNIASMALVLIALALLLVLAGWRIALMVSAGAAVLALLLLTVQIMDNSNGSRDVIAWQPLSKQAIEQAVKENKRLFIDITADWCITCKVNERNVFSRQEIQQLLNAPDVLALRGDWSRPSSQISEFLQQRGQVAIPFNQVYGPARPNGEILPVLLTPQTVKQALMDVKITAKTVTDATIDYSQNDK